jgi:hypothetical protein
LIDDIMPGFLLSTEASGGSRGMDIIKGIGQHGQASSRQLSRHHNSIIKAAYSRGITTGIKAMNQNRGRGRMNQQHGINRGMAKISSRMNQDESLSQALIVSEASDRISSRGMTSWPLMDKSGSSIKGILAMGSIRAEAARAAHTRPYHTGSTYRP